MIIQIVALDKNMAIGINNTIPWHNKEDLKFFKETTLNSTVVMGRKTFESIGKPLPNRHNIVLSKSIKTIEGVTVISSIEELLEKIKKERLEKVFIIGGAEIYKQTSIISDKIIVSEMKTAAEKADTFLDKNIFNSFALFSEEQRESFIIKRFERIKK